MSLVATRTAHDDGITLVELIVGVVVAGLFVGMLAVIFANGLRAQEEATARDHATGSADLASATLQESVRNAATFRVSDSGTRLDAAVATSGSTLTWECRAWKVSGGALYVSTGSTARPADIVSGRKPVVRGVATTLTGGAAFVQATGTVEQQRRVRIGMTVTNGAQTVTLSDAVTAQMFVQGGAPACW